MLTRPTRAVLLGTLAWMAATRPLAAQAPLPLEPARPAGLGVSPVFEGWYTNPDGTHTLSFGYINRNLSEVLDVPAGEQNFVEAPGATHSPPPTHFLPRRHYGVYTVTIPADFPGDRRVVWTMSLRGQKFSIPGHRDPRYMIDALGAPASGEAPPSLKLAAGGEALTGPRGGFGGPFAATVGEALPLTVWATGHDGHPVTVRWYKFSGPGSVRFASNDVLVDDPAGRVATTATFDAPGEYVVYVRANTGEAKAEALIGAGQEQCCWTNGYLKVTVSR